MNGTWFDRHEVFGDCKPNEVYIGCGVFAEYDGPSVRLRDDTNNRIRLDHGSVTILGHALAEWKKRQP